MATSIAPPITLGIAGRQGQPHLFCNVGHRVQTVLFKPSQGTEFWCVSGGGGGAAGDRARPLLKIEKKV